jgi:hypothetical protein
VRYTEFPSPDLDGDPSPTSAVTRALNFSAVLPRVGHPVAETVVSVGAPMVVVLPLTQGMVPPLAKSVAVKGRELPPVNPPMQVLNVVVPGAFPVTMWHVIGSGSSDRQTGTLAESPEQPLRASKRRMLLCLGF